MVCSSGELARGRDGCPYQPPSPAWVLHPQRRRERHCDAGHHPHGGQSVDRRARGRSLSAHTRLALL